MKDTAEYTPVFVGDNRKRLDEILERYVTKRAALLPALWMVLVPVVALVWTAAACCAVSVRDPGCRL